MRDLLNLCLAPPAVWAPYPAGVTTLSAQQFAQYSRFGLKRGMPDIMLFFGKVWGIELKRRGGRLTKTRVVHTRRGTPRELIGQAEMHQQLLASDAWGGIEVAYSVDDVCALLDFWKIPRLGGHAWLAALHPRNAAPLAATFGKPAGGASA